MHEESDEIPLPLFLFFLFFSLHHDARKTVERERERARRPFRSLPHSLTPHSTTRRGSHKEIVARSPSSARSFLRSHLLARITSRFPRRHAPLPLFLCLPPRPVFAFLMNGTSDEVKTSRFPHSRRKPHLTACTTKERTPRREGGGNMYSESRPPMRRRMI